MSVPSDLRYVKTHEWVRLETPSLAVVGITDFAQKELSDIVFVELPKVGAQVAKGKECCVVESVKTASDIYAPLSGKITEVNAALSDTPGLINTDPYAKGWMFKIALSDPAEVSGLLVAKDYESLIG